MSSMALGVVAVSRPRVNQWLIAALVVVPTFMEILNTTIANVALRYIAGGLSAAQTDSEWVITSYLAANAIVLPITGWLAAHLGRRNYFLLSIALFTISSAMCGFATSLSQMIFFRILQGLGGGGLQPCSQGILLDAFPPEKQGTAMTLFGVAAMIAPIVGPSLGGWLCVDYNWRWIFLINVPVGIPVLFAAYALVDDPEYLKQKRAELGRQPLNFDYIGLGVLVLIMSCWEIMLSKGQEWDWLGDPFWRVQTLLAIFVVGLVLLVIWEMRSAHPIIDFRVLGERNFAACCIVMFSTMVVVYCGSIALPMLLQGLMGYDALASGLVMSPAGASCLAAMVVTGILLGRQFDARWLTMVGLVIMAAAYYWLAHMNLEISPRHVIWPWMLMALGGGVLFAPLNMAAYKYTPVRLHLAAVGLFNLLRTEGGSVGTSLSQTIEQRRMQFHLSRLGENLGPLNNHVQSFFDQAQPVFMQWTGDAARSNLTSLQVLDGLRQQQALSLAFFDVFWLCAVLTAALVSLVLLMRRAVAEKGEHVAAH